jgi:hypothetical protein
VWGKPLSARVDKTQPLTPISSASTSAGTAGVGAAAGVGAGAGAGSADLDDAGKNVTKAAIAVVLFNKGMSNTTATLKMLGGSEDAGDFYPAQIDGYVPLVLPLSLSLSLSLSLYLSLSLSLSLLLGAVMDHTF